MTYSEAWIATGCFLFFGIVALCAYFFLPDNRKEAFFVLFLGIIFTSIGVGFFIATLELI
jgi:uncharacterized BrkB/YihY/UPF0761 family membrane protein